MQFSLQHINNFNLLKRHFIKYFKTYITNHINNIIRPFKTKKKSYNKMDFKKDKYIIFLFMYIFYT